MTTGGHGTPVTGLPSPRVDQQWQPGPQRVIAPGGAAGTFRGRLVVVFGTGPNTGLFVYSGTPGAGNLILSITAAAGTDPYGNPYKAGTTSYANDGFGSFIQQNAGFLTVGNTTFPDEANGAGALSFGTAGALTLQAGTSGGTLVLRQDGGETLIGPVTINNSSVPAAPANGVALHSSSGMPKVITSGDGNDYSTARLSLFTTAPQTISSTSDTAITGLITPVAAGTYRVHGMIMWTQGANAVAQNFSFHGPAASHVRIFFEHFLTNSGASNGCGNYNSLGPDVGSPGFAAGSDAFFVFDGIIVFTAAGTFSVQASEGTAGDTFTIDSYSFMDLEPV